MVNITATAQPHVVNGAAEPLVIRSDSNLQGGSMDRVRIMGAVALLFLGACGSEGMGTPGPDRPGADEPKNPNHPDASASFGIRQNWAVPDRQYGLTVAFPRGDALLDMDGDGLPDLVVVGNHELEVLGTEKDRHFEVHLNTGSGFSPPQRWPVPEGVETFAHAPNDTWRCGGKWRWTLGDFNGDGRPDLVVTGVRSQDGEDCQVASFGNTESPHWLLFANTGTSFALVPEEIALPPEFVQHYESQPLLYGRGRHDMDGDGTLDFVFTQDPKTRAVLGHGTGDPHWLVFLVKDAKVQPALRWSLPPGGTSQCGWNDVEGRGASRSPCTVMDPAAGDRDWHMRDVDGDGRPDLLVVASFDGREAQLPEPGAWVLFPNTAAGFGAPLAVPAPTSHPVEIARQTSMAAVELVDVDGDGLLEFVDTSRGMDPVFPHWEVHRYDSTSGFSPVPELWALPQDLPYSGLYGLSITSCASICDEKLPSRRWLTLDLNGDGLIEIVTWSELEGSTLPVGSPTLTIWSIE